MRHYLSRGSAPRHCAVLIGGVVLAGAALAPMSGVAHAELCTASQSAADCQPQDQDGAFATANGQDGRTAGAYIPPGPDDSEPRAVTNGPSGDVTASAVGGGSGAYASSTEGRANSSANGPRSTAATATTDRGNSDARARGRESSSTAAAAGGKADARADGENATSGAAAGAGSTAVARAYGNDSHARAAAGQNDQAYALAGPLSSAEIGPNKARCSGLGAGIETATRSACLGPLATPNDGGGQPQTSAEGAWTEKSRQKGLAWSGKRPD